MRAIGLGVLGGGGRDKQQQRQSDSARRQTGDLASAFPVMEGRISITRATFSLGGGGSCYYSSNRGSISCIRCIFASLNL